MKLKMFNGTVHVENLPVEHRGSNGSTQKRVAAACYSWEHFAAVVGTTAAQIRPWASQCASEPTTAYCMARPGRGFYEAEQTASGWVQGRFELPPLLPHSEKAKQVYLVKKGLTVPTVEEAQAAADAILDADYPGLWRVNWWIGSDLGQLPTTGTFSSQCKVCDALLTEHGPASHWLQPADQANHRTWRSLPALPVAPAVPALAPFSADEALGDRFYCMDCAKRFVLMPSPVRCTECGSAFINEIDSPDPISKP